MARKSLYNYIFTPGLTTVGTVIIPDPYKLGDILMITNVTRNTVIYNFSDPSRGGTVTYTNSPNVTATLPAGTNLSAGQAIFSNLNNGYTTINLTFDTQTAGHQAGDVLQIYVETSELKVRPYDFGIDAVERMKVAAPQSLIDADFEYGPQPTKWVSFSTMNDTPMQSEVPGTDINPVIGSYATFISGGSAASTWISSPAQQNILIQNQGYDGSGQYSQNGPRAWTNEYALIIAQGQAGQANCAAGTTAITNVLPVAPVYGGALQRSFTVANTASWSVGDVMCVVEMPGEGLTGTATGGAVVATIQGGGGITAGNTTVSANNTAISANAVIMVETTQFGIWEAMQVVSGGGSSALTVLRNLWGTNSGNAAILAGARIRQLSGNTTAFYSNANVEVMRLDSIDSDSQFTVTRSWFNVNASPTFGANSIVFKVNHRVNTPNNVPLDAGNVEIVRATVVNPVNLSGNPGQVVARAQLGTTAVSNAGPGSLFIPLTGVFYTGNTSVPSVTAYLPAHGLGNFSNANIGNCYISTIGMSQQVTVSNVEGVYVNTMNDRDYVKYYPKVGLNQMPGYQLNLNDAQTIVRRGTVYTGANLLVANITSNVGSPSLITMQTVYPHGVLPGAAVQVNMQNSAGLIDAASGQFIITSTPTPSSFTYIAKSNIAVNSAGLTGLVANVTPFSLGLVKHRPIDGGNNIGTNTPAHGFEQTRQTKKYFRYQSGKGTMFTTGTQFNPVFTMANIVANATTTPALITVTTENEHGLQANANVVIYGVTTTGFNGTYLVANVSNNNSFSVVQSSVAPASLYPTWGFTNTIAGSSYQNVNYPRVVVAKWHGAKVRGGIFDDKDGVFYEYDGQQLWAVKRNSTMDLVGRVSVAVNSNLVTGDTNTRFRDQLIVGDQLILRGMTHTISQIVDQTHLYVTPPYRGVINAQDIRYTTVKEERTPQKYFNYDRADGSGPSGYVMNLQKMQMIGIQFTWYGAGFVDYMVRALDGRMIILHRSKGNNVNDEAYMRTGNLPARYQASNKGPRTWTSYNILPTATEIRLYDVSEMPNASALGTAVTVAIDNEFITYTGGPWANGNITGLVRGASLNSYGFNSNVAKYMGSNAGTSWIPNGLPNVGYNQNWADSVFAPAPTLLQGVAGGNPGLFVAITGYSNGSTGNQTAFSYDGHSWYAGPTLPSSSAWFSIAYGNINGVDYWVAVSNTTGTTAAWTSNPISGSWTSVTMPATAAWTGIAFGYDNNNVARFVAVSGGPLSSGSSSATAYSSGTNGAPTAFTAGGSFTAAGPWTAIAFGRTSSNTSTTGQATPILNNYFVAVQNTSGGVFNWSTNGGITWNAASAGSGYHCSVAFGSNNWFITAGAFGQTAASYTYWIQGNPTGTWDTSTSLPFASSWRKITYNPYGAGSQGQFWAVSDTVGAPAAYTNNLASATLTGPTRPVWATAYAPTSSHQYTTVVAGQGSVVTMGNVLYQAAVNTVGAQNIFGSIGGNLMATGLPNNVGSWGNATAYGAGIIVTIQSTSPVNGSSTANVAYSFNGGRTWANTAQNVSGGGITNLPWSAMAYAPSIGLGGQGRFVAVAGNASSGSSTVGYFDVQSIISQPATGWLTTSGLPSATNWVDITYINGAFVTVANTATVASSAAYSSNGGIVFTQLTTGLTTASFSAMASGYFPTLANAYVVVAVSATPGGSQSVAVANVQVVNGVSTLSSWQQFSTALPTFDNWTSVAYGTNYAVTPAVPQFVAIAGNTSATGGQRTAYSTNGTTWTAGGNLPAAGYWRKVAYGANGIWVAIMQSTTAGASSNSAAYSSNGGVTWTATSLPIADAWQNVVYATQFNQFVAVSGGPLYTSASGGANVAIAPATGGLAVAHSANTGVRVVSVTASPDLNHWGSAVIMDGGFTVDRTYTFTYNVTNFSVTPVAVPQTAFMMRLAPSLSNAITGELGAKELINRAQVLLQNMYINVNNPASRFLVQGLLNPNNILLANWRPLNTAATYLQPSFTQFVSNTGFGTASASIQFLGQANAASGQVANAATGGEQIFSIPVTQTNSGFLDLALIKEITSMVLPGTGSYPNGNEILAVNFIPVNPQASGGNANVDVQLTYTESQA
jgi:hypothetical protein